MFCQIYGKNGWNHCKAVLPIIGIVLLLCFSIAPISPSVLLLFLMGAALLMVGMMLFTMGAEMSMTPMGEQMGASMTKTKKLWVVVVLSFLLGFLITMSEPDLQVLAQQVPSSSKSDFNFGSGMRRGRFFGQCTSTYAFSYRTAAYAGVFLCDRICIGLFLCPITS